IKENTELVKHYQKTAKLGMLTTIGLVVIMSKGEDDYGITADSFILPVKQEQNGPDKRESKMDMTIEKTEGHDSYVWE
ncbi:6994_t:CDS:2, partial [Gigaspora rosea]